MMFISVIFVVLILSFYVSCTPSIVEEIEDVSISESGYSYWRFYPLDYFSSDTSIYLSVSFTVQGPGDWRYVSPVDVNEFNEFENIQNVYVGEDETILFLTDDYGVNIFEMSIDFDSLEYISTFNTSELPTSFLYDTMNDVIIVGLDERIEFVDISNISSPVNVSSIFTTHTEILTCGENFLCVFDQPSEVLKIYNITDPTSVEEIGDLTHGFPEECTRFSYNLQEGRIYSICGSYIQMIDVSDIFDPILLQNQSIAEISNHSVDAVSKDEYLFILDSSEGILILNATTDSTTFCPKFISSLSTSNNTILESIFIEDTNLNALYVSTSEGDFWIVDITEPTDPFFRYEYQHETPYDGLFVRKNHAYFSSSTGLSITSFGGIRISGTFDVPEDECEDNNPLLSCEISATDDSGTIRQSFTVDHIVGDDGDDCGDDDDDDDDGGNNNTGLAGLIGTVPMFIYSGISVLHLVIYYFILYFILCPMAFALGTCQNPKKVFEKKQAAGGQSQMSLLTPFQVIGGLALAIPVGVVGGVLIVLLANFWPVVDLLLCSAFCLLCCVLCFFMGLFVAVKRNWIKVATKVVPTNQAATVGTELVSTLSGNTQNVVQQVVDGASNVIQNTTSVVDPNTTQQVAQHVVDGASNVVQNVASVVVVDPNATQQITQQVIDGSSSVVQNTTSAIGDGAQQVVQQASNVIQNVTSVVTDPTLQGAQQMIDGAIGPVLNTGNTAASTVMGSAQNIIDGTQPVAEGASGVIQGALDATVNVVQVSGGLIENVGIPNPVNLTENVVQPVTDVQNVVNVVEQVGDVSSLLQGTTNTTHGGDENVIDE